MNANSKDTDEQSTKRCHGCRAQLTDITDSVAHIIPNALGGRLASRGVICRDCNSALDRLADNPLVQVFAQWPTLLNIPRQRGAHPPATVKDTEGNEFRVEADGARTIGRPEYGQKATEDGHKVEIRAAIWKQADQLIGRAAKQFPQLDPKEARNHAQMVSEVPRYPWHIPMNFAPNKCFPGAMTALWLFHVFKSGRPFIEYGKLVEWINQEALVGRLHYMPDGFPGLSGPSREISHQLVLKSVGKGQRQLIGYVEILGVLRIGGVLCDNYGADIEEIYAADPFLKDEFSGELVIDSAVVESTDWAKVGISFDPDTAKTTLLPRLENAASVLQTAWHQREANHAAAEVKLVQE